MSRLSLPVPLMKAHYDVVVIGSGYGGSIAACRMSRAGKHVALLEKGAERWPGEYPTKTLECLKEIQYSSAEKHIGKETGMYHFYRGAGGNGQCAFVGCGLGGTSLINANVALEAHDNVWKMDCWPEEIKNDINKIKKGYERANEMLQPESYPDDFPSLPKLEVLKEQAEKLGCQDKFRCPPITVTFEDRINAAGVMQKRSTLTGNDTTGVNDGSKNSTLMNYIPDAWNHGCEIFCKVDVRRIKKYGKKWIIFYKWLDEDRREIFNNDNCNSPYFVTADVVFLAAGTLGTNEILLRSKAYGLEISPQLGKDFSGNGDILGFGYNTDRYCNGVAMGDIHPSDFEHPVGPCITGIIDMRGNSNIMHDYVIEEGVIPFATATVANFLLRVSKGIEPNNNSLYEKLSRNLRELLSKVSNYRGAMVNTQTYLIMSHDNNTGHLELQNDRLNIEFEGAGCSKTVKVLNDILKDITLKLNGTYISSPLWDEILGGSLLTVHPIGGCGMGKTGYVGVVNHKGQVYKREDTEVYENLYVCDGSIIPRSLGVNPFYTISALAERICDLAANDMKCNIDYKLVSGPINFNKPVKQHRHLKPIREGISFTEVMRGYFSTEITTDDYKAAELQAKTTNSTMQFLINIMASDVNALTNLKNDRANIYGTVSCRALSPDPLRIMEGCFRLFIEKSDRVDSNNMMYNLNLLATDGTKYRFKGFKILDNCSLLNALEEVTTLYVTVYKGRCTGEFCTHDDEDVRDMEVIGRGILKIKICDFIKQMKSFELIGPTAMRKAVALFEFTTFFASTMIKRVLTRFLPLQYDSNKNKIQRYPNGDRPKRQDYEVIADDNVSTKLYRYNAGKNGPVLLIHGASVTHNMFATDLIKNNFLDYLLENKYDVFLTDYRIATTHKDCNNQQKLEECILDLKAVVNKVNEVTECKNIAVVSHCLGSVLTFMGLLNGEIKGVGSLIGSQVAMHPLLGFWNNVKSNMHLVEILKYGLFQSSFDVRTSPNTSLLQSIINQALRFYPFPPGGTCRSALCHRSSLAFGTLYKHENLSQQLHDNLGEFMGQTNLTTLQHFTKAAKVGELVDYDGDKVYVTDDNVKNYLNFPIHLLYGKENTVYDIKGIRQSYEKLISINDAAKYTLHLIPNYGHLDCWWGTNAHIDVFPKILRHLEDTKNVYGYSYHV